MSVHQNELGQWIDDAGNIVGDPKGGGYDPRYPPGSTPPPPAGVTPEDLRYITNPSIPTQFDANKGLYYTTSYDGSRNYLPPASGGGKPNTFWHTYNWNPLTGEYDSHLNGGGGLGAVEGAAAVAGPAVIGPALAGGGGAAAGGAGINTGFDTAGLSSVVPSSVAGASADAGLGAVPLGSVGAGAAGINTGFDTVGISTTVPSSVGGASADAGFGAAPMASSVGVDGWSAANAPGVNASGADILNAGGVPGAAGGFWDFLKGNFPLIYGLGSSAVGTALAAHAASKAANQEAQAAQQALDFEKQRYADAQANFGPYIKTGQQAVTTLGNFMMPANGPAPTADNLIGRFNGTQVANMQNNGSRMVTLKAPTGEVRQVPDFQVPGFLAHGATVV